MVDPPDVSGLRSALEAFVALPADRQQAWERDIAATASHYAWPNVAAQIISELGFD